jgi:hypothetical protein
MRDERPAHDTKSPTQGRRVGGYGKSLAGCFAYSYPGTASPAPNSSIRTFCGVAKATDDRCGLPLVRTLAKVLDLRLGVHMDGAWNRCVNRRATG